MSAIPEEWIQGYVDTWIKAAQKLGPDTVLGKAALDRADHAMDLVEAWRNRDASPARPSGRV